ncbi:MAG: tetratricopeptide repeat protein [Gemmatimonadales bacterium]|nr:tetratricopeptide repeat protein [Gemmatimonadales bacterium]
MIRFHTLGVLDLRGPDGRELRTVLQQPKRLGLLAYLAVNTPRRFHRRDSLLALFWPELDQEHARAALRRALYFLRAELGAEVVSGRGDEEVGAPDAALWCDATALEQSLTTGDAETALAHYRGPLLDGLYVAGAAPELQDWLDRERVRLRERAATAARALAGSAEHAGRLGDAAAWTRRELELAPNDEAVLRRYVRLLDRTGERSAALRAYEDFAQRLAQELELEPSAETRGVVEALRARVESQPVRPSPTPPAGAVGAAPATPWTTIAVLPFSIRGAERFSYLGEGMVDLLATKLDRAGEIRTVDPRALLRSLDGVGATVEEGADTARRFGAGRYLVGTVVEAGGRLQATATLYRLDGATVASVHAAAAGEGEIFELVDELARQLLAVHGVAPGTRLSRIAALTTDSLDALKCYLLGERELRDGRYFDAMERFQAAVDADASFALAYYRLAAAAAGCALPDLARETADRGAEHQDRLSPHDRLVFAAQRAWLHGAVDRAESLYNTITGAYPDDVEAWFHLGDLLFHSNPLRGRSAVEAREPFERVLQFEPDHVAAMVHLVRISAIEGKTGAMVDLIERILRASPDGDQALAMRALRAYTTRDRSAIAQVNAELQQARAITVAIAFADVALYSGNLDGAAGLARGFLQVARSAELRALCHILLAHLALAGGDADGMRAELRTAESLDATWGLEMRALFATLPFVDVPEAELRETRDALERWNPAEAAPSMFVIFAMHNDLHPAIRAYLLGLLELRLGEPARAAERLEALAELEAGGPLVRNLTVELDAALAQARGKPAEALARLERARPELWFQLTVASPFFSLASQRFLRARLLEETGRPREAAGWYRSMAERSPYELVYARAAGEALEGIRTEGRNDGRTE